MLTWEPTARLEPGELAATVISFGSPASRDGWTSVWIRPKLEMTNSEPVPPHLNTAIASPRRFI